MFEPDAWEEPWEVFWVGIAGKTDSGEKTRGLGGWRRGKLESDMNVFARDAGRMDVIGGLGGGGGGA